MTHNPNLLAALISAWKQHNREVRSIRQARWLSDHIRRDAGLPPFGPAPRNPFTEGW